MVGFNPRSALVNAPGVAENLEKLREPGNVLFDSIRRPEYGPVAEVFRTQGKVMTEVGGREVEIAGLFELGTSFAIDGMLIMSDETFLRILSHRQRGIIDVGLIRLKPGTDAVSVKKQVEQIMPPDVRVLTKQEFIQLENRYWTTYTPTGFIFKLGVLMAIFVGCIIVYQILYTDVSDHLPEYATVKAMGFPDRYLFSLVLQESLILSVLGFVPGVLVSHVVYNVSRDATLLPLRMTVGRGAVVYLLTAIMCAISAAFAMRRLKSADPADIF
jgi:putative ABC transport system permease protein